MDTKLNRIAKRIIKASFIDTVYYFTNVGKNLVVCMRYFHPHDIEAFGKQILNIKGELQRVSDELSKYGAVKQYQDINFDTGMVELFFVFSKTEDGDDDSLISFLQKNGFSHQN